MCIITPIFYLFLLLGCQPRPSDTTVQTLVDKPNILLIVVDDQGYADFAPFENHDTTSRTPHMARLVQSGTVYTQA